MQVNISPISQFAQILRSAEQANQKEIKIPITQARNINLALTEILDQMNQDYQSLINNIANPNDEVVSIKLDGGSF